MNVPAPRQILLVEDDPQTTQVMARMVRARGFAVVVARSLEEARQCAAQDNIGFVISDVGLPDGKGWELMRELRDRFGLEGVAISGFGMEADLARSREAGFVLHLTKPIQIGDLNKALALAQRALGPTAAGDPP